MGTLAPAGPSLGHPSSHYLLVCAPQLLLAPFQDPPSSLWLVRAPSSPFPPPSWQLL